MEENLAHSISIEDIPAGFSLLRYCDDGSIEPMFANGEFFALMGYEREAGELYPAAIARSEGWRGFAAQLAAGIEAGKATIEIEGRQEVADGSVQWMRTRCAYDPARRMVFCAVLDVTQWMETSDRLRMSEESFRIAARMSGKNIATYDIAGRTLTLLEAGEGYLSAPKVVRGIPERAIEEGAIAPESVEVFRGFYHDIQAGVPRGSAEVRMKAFDIEEFRWFQSDYSLVRNRDGDPAYAVIAFGDVTERRERERMQKHLAERDALTGMFNRATFESLCESLIGRSTADSRHAFFMVDFDHFKATNDRFGHAVGDLVIAEAVKGLASAVREGDLVGRIGGDEFMVCLPGVSSRSAIDAAASRMCVAVANAASAEGAEGASSTVSIGIALFPRDGTTYDELYRNADAAMYRAKRGGGNAFAYYSGEERG